MLREEYNIKIYVKKIKYVSVYWIHLSKDTDQWRTLVNTVIKLLVPYTAECFLTS
jgi:hypothetical protein